MAAPKKGNAGIMEGNQKKNIYNFSPVIHPQMVITQPEMWLLFGLNRGFPTPKKNIKARPMAMWLSTCLHIGLSFSSPRRASNATGWRTLSGLVILLSGAHCSLNHTHSLDKKCRFLLTPKTLALKEYFPLTSTDGPWLIRSAHFAQKKYMEGPHSQCRRLDLEFMIGVWEVRP